MVVGKEFSKIPVGTPILCDNKNPDSSKVKCPNWCKGTVKDRKNPRSYKILMDNDIIVTRSRCHIKAYLTRSVKSQQGSSEVDRELDTL